MFSGLPPGEEKLHRFPRARRHCGKVFLGLLAFFLVAYGGGCWYLWTHQRDLIFAPSRDMQRTPADLGLSFEEVWLPVGGRSSVTLHGWWLPSSGREARALLYLHGNDLNIAGEIDRIARLQRMGFSVLAVDYRGFGKSGGEFPSELQVYEDAEAAWNYLVQARQVDARQTFIYGHSLGGAVAIDLAVRHPEAAGLVVEATFTSMSEMAKSIYWIFPVDWLLNQRFDSLAKVRELHIPVLFVHGTADTDVPYAMSEALFAAASEPKRLTLIPGGGHEDSATVGDALYARALLDFVHAAR